MTTRRRGAATGKIARKLKAQKVAGSKAASALTTRATRSTTTRAIRSMASPPKALAQLREVGPTIPQRTDFLIRVLGSQARVAELLEVSRSQPGRWSKGEESPSPQRARELIDLDHIVARAVSWLGPEMTTAWLNGSNAFLDGARPIDVLRLRGSSEVIDAIDAEMSGAFA